MDGTARQRIFSFVDYVFFCHLSTSFIIISLALTSRHILFIVIDFKKTTKIGGSDSSMENFLFIYLFTTDNVQLQALDFLLSLLFDNNLCNKQL